MDCLIVSQKEIIETVAIGVEDIDVTIPIQVV